MAGAANIVALYSILKFTTFVSAVDLAVMTGRISLRSVQTVIGRSMKCAIDQIGEHICDSRELIRGNGDAFDSVTELFSRRKLRMPKIRESHCANSSQMLTDTEMNRRMKGTREGDAYSICFLHGTYDNAGSGQQRMKPARGQTWFRRSYD